MARWVMEILDSASPTKHQALIELWRIGESDMKYPKPCPFIWTCSTPGAFLMPKGVGIDPLGYPTTIPGPEARREGERITSYMNVRFYIPTENNTRKLIFDCDGFVKHYGGVWPVIEPNGTGTIYCSGTMEIGPMNWRMVVGAGDSP